MPSGNVHYSSAALKTVEEIIEECDEIFRSLEAILGSFRRTEGPGLFPSLDFVGRVKWTFKKSRVQVLRSTWESFERMCSIRLGLLSLSNHYSRTAQQNDAEDDGDELITQSLIISRQCAIDQLSAVEDEDDINAPLYKRLGGRPDPRPNSTESEHSRMSRLLNGLSLRTDSAKMPVRTKRASLWLSDMVLGEGDPQAPHPGTQRKRLSSTEVKGRPQQLLRKWTDPAEANGINGRVTHTQAAAGVDAEKTQTWDDDSFTFSLPATPGSSISPMTHVAMQPLLARRTTNLVSPRISNVVNNMHHEFGRILRQKTFGTETATTPLVPIRETATVIVGSLEAAGGNETTSVLGNTGAILAAFEAARGSQHCSLWVSYGGHRRIVEHSEDPATVLKQLSAMGL